MCWKGSSKVLIVWEHDRNFPCPSISGPFAPLPEKCGATRICVSPLLRSRPDPRVTPSNLGRQLHRSSSSRRAFPARPITNSGQQQTANGRACLPADCQALVLYSLSRLSLSLVGISCLKENCFKQIISYTQT